MKRKTKSEQYRREYFKIRRDAERFIRDATKRGYSMPELPKIPKRITKQSVESLRRRTNKTYLYSKSTFTYYNPEFKKTYTVSGDIGKSIERSLAARKGYETRRNKEVRYLLDKVKQTQEKIRQYEENKEKYGWDDLVPEIPSIEYDISEPEVVDPYTGEIVPESEAIDYSIVDKIYEKLEEIPIDGCPDAMGRWHTEIYAYKKQAIDAFSQKIDETYDSGTYDEYVKYLHNNEQAITAAFNTLDNDWYYEQIVADITAIITLLQRSPLSMEQSRVIGEAADYYSYTPYDEIR